MNVLAVSAWEPELTRFRELAAALESRPEMRIQIRIRPLGVGVVDAAIAMTQCIGEAKPDLALFIGTCGSLAPDLAVGDVVAASQVVLVGTGAIPGPMVTELTLDPALHHALVSVPGRARSAHVVNTIGVTVDDAYAETLRGRAHVEHLEAFGFARACAAANVPAAVVLGVANPVGSSGREAWKANHQRASDAAAAIAAELLVRTSTTRPTPA